MKYVVHLGTGTYFALDNDVFILDSRDIPDEWDDNDLEPYLYTITETYGLPFSTFLSDYIKENH